MNKENKKNKQIIETKRDVENNKTADLDCTTKLFILPISFKVWLKILHKEPKILSLWIKTIYLYEVMYSF